LNFTVLKRYSKACSRAREFVVGFVVLRIEGMPLPKVPPLAPTNEFLLNRAKQTQWNAFCRGLGLRDAPSLDVIGPLLVRFLDAGN
jgi:hypothetical protein